MGHPLGFRSWGCLGGPGFVPVRLRCGDDADAWVTEVLAAPGTQGGWRLWRQETWCSRRVWQPILANTLQYSCLENPLSYREPWQATVYRDAKGQTWLKRPSVHTYETFFCPWQLCPGESWAWRWCSSLAWGDTGSANLQGHRLPPLQELWPYQSLFSSLW